MVDVNPVGKKLDCEFGKFHLDSFSISRAGNASPVKVVKKSLSPLEISYFVGCALRTG